MNNLGSWAGLTFVATFGCYVGDPTARGPVRRSEMVDGYLAITTLDAMKNM